jgi:hypothetical protein
VFSFLPWNSPNLNPVVDVRKQDVALAEAGSSILYQWLGETHRGVGGRFL